MEEMFFSNNRKISARQVQRALTLEMLGVSTLILPRLLAGLCGTDGVFALLLGAGGAVLLLKLWGVFTGRRDFYSALKNCGRAVRLLLSLCYGALFLGIAGYVLFMLTKVVEEQLLDVKFEPVILLTLTAAGVFGLLKGLESRVRIYEVLFWFLLIPLAVILGLAAVSVNPDYWPPVFAADLSGFFKGVYLSFLYFSLSSMYLLFQPHCSRPEQAFDGVRRAVWTALFFNVVIYLILTGIFQSGLLANLPYPVITLMAVVKLPGEFFERQDAFMAAIWFFCLFALLNSMLFYGKEMLQNAVRACLPGSGGEEKRQAGGKNALWVCFCGAGILTAALVFLRVDAASSRFFGALAYGLLPLALSLPALVFFAGRKEKKS